MTLVYKYKKISNRPTGDEIKAPQIFVTISGRFSMNTTAIPDSGADFTAIRLSIAKLIGLDLSANPEKCVGIGGIVQAISSMMVIELGNEHET